MGRYLNPGMESFEKSVNSEIYVDKKLVCSDTRIGVMNTVQDMSALTLRGEVWKNPWLQNMLGGILQQRLYDSREIFSKFEISESPDFEKYRNKYNTIFLNMQVVSEWKR
ncbi:MAG: hypothetical protein ACLS61_07315 [Ruminococcus sp.]